MDYQDFEIELTTLADGTHQVNVLDTPAGETRQQLAFSLSDEALREKLAHIETTLRDQKELTAEEKRAQVERVKRFGGSLFDALINDNLKSLYDQSRYIVKQRGQGLRLKLRIQSSLLTAVPWELLYDPRFDEFLCTSRQVSVARYVALPRAAQLMATKPPLNVLGVVAAPGNLPPLDVALEKQQVEAALRPLVDQGLASLTWLEAANRRALLRAMNRGPWHVFHYVGHSGFDVAADEGYLSLLGDDGREERLSAGKLAMLLADHGTLRLVVLNSCMGARIGQDIYAGLATTLVRRGIPAVIGMQYDISDEAALTLAQTFYETLAENLPIETALAEARKAISLAVDESAEWGTPVFYTHAPDSVLFDVARPVETPSTLVVDKQVLDHLAYSMDRSAAASGRIDQLVGTVRRLAPQLKAHPEQTAYAGLVAALDEVAKTWQVTNAALEEVWQLYKANGDLKDVSEGLLDIGDYQLQARVEMGRGHCHIISDIYFTHLQDWFTQTLTGDDLMAIENLFMALGNADQDVFQDMVQVAAQIEATANQVLSLVEDDRADEARAVARELRRTLSPLRAAINQSLVLLKQLRQEFTGIARPSAGATVLATESIGDEASMTDPTYLTQIYELLMAHFSESELQTLCFYLGIDYESLVGAAKPGKARALVQYCDRAGRLADLREKVMGERPSARWPEAPQNPPVAPPEEKIPGMDADAWVAALMGCATMTNRDRRDDVVRDLPPHIQGNIERRTALYDDVYNITRTCMQYNGGLEILVAVIKKREGPTASVQKLETLL